MTDEIFLDTTIQIDRLLQTADVQANIQQNLTNKRIYTSSTVYMEFKRTILQDIRYVHALVERKCAIRPVQTVLLSDIDRWLAGGEGNFSIRSRDRCKFVTATIKDAIPQNSVHKNRLFTFLQTMRFNLEMDFFSVDLGDNGYFDISEEDTYIDIAGCVLSRPEYPSGDILNTRLSCSAATTACKLDQFLTQHADELQAIHRRLSTLPAQQRDQRAFNVLTDVLANGYRRALGERSCWALGDIVIALESPNNAAIYTTNEKHFSPLCEALSKQLISGI
ncbi:MAG: hypothetical protein AAF639_30215 [Chloroflexota bacterium]